VEIQPIYRYNISHFNFNLNFTQIFPQFLANPWMWMNCPNWITHTIHPLLCITKIIINKSNPYTNGTTSAVGRPRAPSVPITFSSSMSPFHHHHGILKHTSADHQHSNSTNTGECQKLHQSQMAKELLNRSELKFNERNFGINKI
jgi:hypothetical protein